MVENHGSSFQLATLDPRETLTQKNLRCNFNHNQQGRKSTALKEASRSPDLNRPYLFGDPLKSLDWKVYAKNNQLIVREKYQESRQEYKIYLDLSPSMQWPDEKFFPGKISKIELATRIACHLLYNLFADGEKVELLCFYSNQKEKLATSFESLPQIIEFFERAKEESFHHQVLRHFFSKEETLSSKTSNTILISDMITSQDEVFRFLKGKSKTLLHIQSSMEKDFSWIKEDHCYTEEEGTFFQFSGKKLKEKNFLLEKTKAWQRNIHTRIFEIKGECLEVSETMQVSDYQSRLERLSWRISL